ncbi:MAG: 3-oxoacyl-ACP reductase family protein [Bacillota bacterium]
MKRVAVVTGASRGIGRACALRLARDGISIVVNYNNSPEKAMEVVEEIKKAGSESIAIKADVSSSKEVQALFRETINHFGQLDILVNNVGIVDDSFIMMLGDSSLDKSLSINLKSYFYCCKQAALKMFKQRRGKIINISSVSSIKGIPGQSVYSATKGAINSMTGALAAELAQYGIQVNAVAPGFIDTDMLNSVPEDKKKQYIDLIPLKRFGKADEVAETVSFLCSGNVDYITGQVIIIDGGLSI